MPEDIDVTWKYQRAPERLDIDEASVVIRRDGTGAALLYLHGAAFLRQWLPIHAKLAGDFDVIAPEHPGFGDSPAVSGFRDFSDYVLLYDALLRRLDVKGAHLVGHGLGARLAAHLATVYPDRFATLTLISPVGLGSTDSALIDEFRLSTEERRSREFNGREADHIDVLTLKGFPDDAIDTYADTTTNALLTWSSRRDRQLVRRLPRVEAPTLVIAPEDDRYAGPSSAARYADLIPGAVSRVIPGPCGAPSSHAVHIEQPDEVAEAILAHTQLTTPKEES